jgi:hypothetical protein
MPDFPIVTQYGEQSWYAFNGNVTSMEVFVFKVQDHSALGIDNGAKILGVASFGSPIVVDGQSRLPPVYLVDVAVVDVDGIAIDGPIVGNLKSNQVG